MRGSVNFLLALGLVMSLLLNVMVRRPAARPNYEYFPDMARGARYSAFSHNPNFADGMTLRAPVPGTISREVPPLPKANAPGPPMTSPFASDDRTAQLGGAQVFANFCQPCHGADAKGDGLVVKHGFPAPPSLLTPRTEQMPDAQIFRIITNGQGGMPSYGAQIPREDRWRAVAYLRALQHGQIETPRPAR
jgi:mono/diheme cytochrome c family protein